MHPQGAKERVPCQEAISWQYAACCYCKADSGTGQRGFCAIVQVIGEVPRSWGLPAGTTATQMPMQGTSQDIAHQTWRILA